MGRRGKKSISKSEIAFREEIAEKFREAIAGKHRGSKTDAAFALGISRQALYNYLNGTQTPGGRVIQRACTVWKIALSDRGYVIDAGSYPAPTTSAKPIALQLSLLDAISSLEDNQLSVKMLRKTSESVRLQVEVRFAR